MILLLFAAGVPQAVQAATVAQRYPGLSMSLLQSAVLAPLDEDTLLVADEVTIHRSHLLDSINGQDPKLRLQLEKNLFFILEQQAVHRILISQARKAGFDKGDDQHAVQALFDKQTRTVTVSEAETRVFYASNKEVMGGVPFEQAADSIRQYLLQDKKKQVVSDYIDGLGTAVKLRINAQWVDEHSRLAAENPVDIARRSGRPTLVEFGAKGCIPCDMMQPILDNLRKNFPQTLNIVFVHVGEEQILSSRYGIRSIPVQVFFDAEGKEVFRHVGFFAEKDVLQQLKKMGVQK
jgi:thiol-disulfide isomerase/thioredoxin